MHGLDGTGGYRGAQIGRLYTRRRDLQGLFEDRATEIKANAGAAAAISGIAGFALSGGEEIRMQARDVSSYRHKLLGV
jgi:hypothetical protein